jgi:2-keto-4-pentenoate hydratase/2-oxohepta-3-ene-1,7-dioic acid hydratase in catechol pathway
VSSGKSISTPVDQPRNIYCIGLNYTDHAAESGLPIPEEPILFNKSASAFCGHNDPVLFSPSMTKLDWEVELGIVNGKSTLNISAEDAMDRILGYTLVNDVSERPGKSNGPGNGQRARVSPISVPPTLGSLPRTNWGREGFADVTGCEREAHAGRQHREAWRG